MAAAGCILASLNHPLPVPHATQEAHAVGIDRRVTFLYAAHAHTHHSTNCSTWHLLHDPQVGNGLGCMNVCTGTAAAAAAAAPVPRVVRG